MCHELQPLRQAFSAELKGMLAPAGPGIEPQHLVQSYLDRLTIYVSCDVADRTFLGCLPMHVHTTKNRHFDLSHDDHID